jgi:DNA-binding MarR family transcriptional regulator
MKSEINQDCDISTLESHLGYWIRLVSNQVSQSFAAKLSGLEVTVAEWVILREMYGQGSIVPSQLAKRLGMTRGAISKLADRLAAKALLTQASRGGDRRFQTLELTPAGLALVPELARLADRNDAEFFGQLDPQQRDQIELAMKNIAASHGFRGAPLD